MKILKFLTCVTSKHIAFWIDSGSFLEFESSSLRPWLLQSFSLTKSTNFCKLLGGGLPPSLPASDGPGNCLHSFAISV